MIPLAHFTPEELPVTLAILLAGVIIGIVIGLLVARGALGHSSSRRS